MTKCTKCEGRRKHGWELPFLESNCPGNLAGTFHIDTFPDCPDHVPEVWAVAAPEHHGSLNHTVQPGMAGAFLLKNP